MSELDRFKLNGLVLKTDPDNFLAVLHFNVPLRYLVRDELAPKLERIRQVVDGEFEEEIARRKLYFSVSATYVLTHGQTGQTKLWQGSYSPRNNENYYILPSQVFDSATFVQEVAPRSNVDLVSARLRVQGLDTEWQFSELKSLIYSFIASCSFDDHRLGPERIVLAPFCHGTVGRRQFFVYPLE